MMPTPNALIDAITRRGYRPHWDRPPTLRDAVHEAAHALDYDVSAPWSRVAIHDAMPDEVSDRLAAEFRARAVERIVCERLGEPLDQPDYWIMVMGMEFTRDNRVSISFHDLRQGVEHHLKDRDTMMLADLVMALT